MFFNPSSLFCWVFVHGCMDTCAVLGVLHGCVLYLGICACSALLSMFHMEGRFGNKIIIIFFFVF